MTDKISPATVSALSETMLIPLWAKAVEQQRPQPLLKDAEAPRMLAMIDYDFDRFKGARMSQPGCCGRAALIDDEVRAFIRQHPDAVVAQIGAGIDARFERLGRPAITAWVDMDLPEVIALRERFAISNSPSARVASVFPLVNRASLASRMAVSTRAPSTAGALRCSSKRPVRELVTMDSCDASARAVSCGSGEGVSTSGWW